YHSYTTNNQKGTVRIENGYIKLPKLKSMVRIKQHRMFDGEIKSCTISRTPGNRYYISILAETEIEKLKTIDKKIGVDVGL
ncbi:transposase, partial [Clostridioides sp. ZZV14-6154]|nr:transposase [Clostridioides sp. ZZV14-6154]